LLHDSLTITYVSTGISAVATKKKKINDSNNDNAASLKKALKEYSLERMKVKDYVTTITRIENTVNYNDTKLIHLIGLMIKCDPKSEHYIKLQSMYDETIELMKSSKNELNDVYVDYEQYKTVVEERNTPTLCTPEEVVVANEDETISLLDNINIEGTTSFESNTGIDIEGTTSVECNTGVDDDNAGVNNNNTGIYDDNVALSEEI
jgi:hypothetical protein